jgi:hypothetical protein
VISASFFVFKEMLFPSEYLHEKGKSVRKCVSLLFNTVTKCLRKRLHGRWVCVGLEISVPDYLALLFIGLWQGRNSMVDGYVGRKLFTS